MYTNLNFSVGVAFTCKLYIAYFFAINCWKILSLTYSNGVFWVYYTFEVSRVFKNIYNLIFPTFERIGTLLSKFA